MAPRVRSLAGGPETRFIADAMLGRLARWLRMLGFDCAWQGEIDDEELVLRANREQRIVLTRDRALPEEWRLSGIHLVGSEDLREQLREVVERFELWDSLRPFSRCTACSQPLREAARDAVADRAPPRVLATHERFLECPGCRRVYWEGSHTRRVRRVVDELCGTA
jgi:hypothetical protein